MANGTMDAAGRVRDALERMDRAEVFYWDIWRRVAEVNASGNRAAIEEAERWGDAATDRRQEAKGALAGEVRACFGDPFMPRDPTTEVGGLAIDVDGRFVVVVSLCEGERDDVFIMPKHEIAGRRPANWSGRGWGRPHRRRAAGVNPRGPVRSSRYRRPAPRDIEDRGDRV